MHKVLKWSHLGFLQLIIYVNIFLIQVFDYYNSFSLFALFYF